MFNKSKYFIFAFSLVLLLNVKPLFGQFGRETARGKAAKEEINNELKSRFGDKVDVKVSAKVEMNENYSYSYDVLVSSESDQALVAFTIEIKTRGKKNSEDLIINNPVNSNWGGSILMPTVKPESFKGSEITWVPLDTLEYYSDQFLMPNSSIKQGDSINFSFESKGLPIIARFWCLGWYKPITVSEYDSLKTTGFEESDILKPWYLNAKQGYTVSSSAIPNPFIPLDFIDTLITYADSS